MFKKRRIELRIVKDETPTETTTTTKPVYDYAAETQKAIKQIIVGTVVVAGVVTALNVLGAIAIASIESIHD